MADKKYWCPKQMLLVPTLIYPFRLICTHLHSSAAASTAPSTSTNLHLVSPPIMPCCLPLFPALIENVPIH